MPQAVGLRQGLRPQISNQRLPPNTSNLNDAVRAGVLPVYLAGFESAYLASA
jgi:hypothetical protein